jgi:hypothetical protein
MNKEKSLTQRFSGRATTAASGKLSMKDTLIPVLCSACYVAR